VRAGVIHRKRRLQDPAVFAAFGFPTEMCKMMQAVYARVWSRYYLAPPELTVRKRAMSIRASVAGRRSRWSLIDTQRSRNENSVSTKLLESGSLGPSEPERRAW